MHYVLAYYESIIRVRLMFECFIWFWSNSLFFVKC